jgi:maltooligosyltrehalose trehalohydrolase
VNRKLGAICLGQHRCRFCVWAPAAQQVGVHLLAPRERLLPLQRDPRGYHSAEVEDVEPGSLYRYRLNGREERPDPASRCQPQGVHGPSQVVDAGAFPWSDAGWKGVRLEDYILYELHVGTFTPAGTFEAIVPRLDTLKELGVTALELMPVAQFPGSRNWGYDGVFPFAVQSSYGGPDGLKKLVDAAHQRGLAMVLDVVFNHLGPEGNCFADFGPYFTDRYHTPWGPAINFDGPLSDEVRHFFIRNALYWVTEFHFDALRLDAIHGIFDFSAQPFLAELADAVHRQAAALGRRIYLIPESDLNDARLVEPRAVHGYGLDAQWSDDFHHALHALLTGERSGYYVDFGRLEHLAKAFREGFVYGGLYSEFRRRRHGSSSAHLPAHQFVVCAQNHDQVGNRVRGERLTQLVSFGALKLAAGLVLLSPFVPLLFMGEEYGEAAPFQYFVSHSKPEVIEAVRAGRKREFVRFGWQEEPPDPQDATTFERCKLRAWETQDEKQQTLRRFYRELIRLRRALPALAHLSKEEMTVVAREEDKVLCLCRGRGADQVFAAFHFGPAQGELSRGVPPGHWRKILDSAEKRWGGGGSHLPDALQSQGSVSLSLSPHSFALFVLEGEA